MDLPVLQRRLDISEHLFYPSIPAYRFKILGIQQELVPVRILFLSSLGIRYDR